MKRKKELPTEADIDQIVKDLHEARKSSGTGEYSYSTDGVIEKVTAGGYTVWQRHGTMEKALKEHCKKLEDDFRNNKHRNEANK